MTVRNVCGEGGKYRRNEVSGAGSDLKLLKSECCDPVARFFFVRNCILKLSLDRSEANQIIDPVEELCIK